MSAEPVEPTGATSPGAGLAAELRRLAEALATSTGLPCVIGEPPADQPDGLRLEVVRLLPQPYRIDAHQARAEAEVLLSAAGGAHAEQAERVATALLRLLAEGRWDVIAGQPEASTWTALARPAAPAIMVTVPFALTVPRAVARPVRHPLQLDDVATRELTGRVLAADGTPLPGALVRLLPDGRFVRADHRGRWSLRATDRAARLEVLARRQRVLREVPAGPAAPPIDIELAGLGAAGPADDRPPRS